MQNLLSTVSRILRLGLVILFLATVNALPSYAASEPLPNSTTLFTPVVAELQGTGLPLRLPTYIPSMGLSAYEFFPTLTAASSDGYEIIIGDRTPCLGANYCRFGTVSATRLANASPSIEQLVAPPRHPKYRPSVVSTEKSGYIKLANGTQAYFDSFTCGANCSDSRIIWDENQIRYSVGIKQGLLEDLYQMANSTLRPGP